jgi:hypothetical protein
MPVRSIWLTVACGPHRQTQRSITTGRGETLSEELSCDERVLYPPNLYPDIKLPTLDVRNTPVIPTTVRPESQPQTYAQNGH